MTLFFLIIGPKSNLSILLIASENDSKEDNSLFYKV